MWSPTDAELSDMLVAGYRLQQGLIDGRVDMRQAAVIAATVNAIPADLAAVDAAPTDLAAAADDDAGGLPQSSLEQITAQAEAMLIDMAGQFPARELRRLGDRILAHVAPEIAERADEAALRREDARARRKRFVTLSAPFEGMVRVSGLLGVEDAAVVRAALDPLCAPITGDDRSPGQRRADALVDVCRLALRTGQLPEDGGEPAQVTLTIPYDPLTTRLRIGTLDTGDRVSAATARRMACDARILPVVLGGAGQILDAGRARRLVTGALRRALVARDRGCAFPALTGRPDGAAGTTCAHGPTGARPAWTTSPCSAAGITASSTSRRAAGRHGAATTGFPNSSRRSGSIKGSNPAGTCTTCRRSGRPPRVRCRRCVRSGGSAAPDLARRLTGLASAPRISGTGMPD